MLCPHSVDIVLLIPGFKMCLCASVYNVEYMQSSVFKCVFASVFAIQYKNRAVKDKVYYITCK